jgi:hypothetical protein
LKSRHIQHSFLIAKETGTSWAASQSRERPTGNSPLTANKRLAQQIRKILGKRYASKYRVR